MDFISRCHEQEARLKIKGHPDAFYEKKTDPKIQARFIASREKRGAKKSARAEPAVVDDVFVAPAPEDWIKAEPEAPEEFTPLAKEEQPEPILENPLGLAARRNRLKLMLARPSVGEGYKKAMAALKRTRVDTMDINELAAAEEAIIWETTSRHGARFAKNLSVSAGGAAAAALKYRGYKDKNAPIRATIEADELLQEDIASMGGWLLAIAPVPLRIIFEFCSDVVTGYHVPDPSAPRIGQD